MCTSEKKASGRSYHSDNSGSGGGSSGGGFSGGGAVLLAVAARPVAGNSTIKKRQPEGWHF
ncbi:hypothetical protein HTS61_17265 [Escherichia coli]|nr:hypothetical protein [Escherichia coli]